MPKGRVGVAPASGLRWPNPKTGPWAVQLTPANRDGVLECVGITIAPLRDDCPPLTAKLLRTLSLPDLMAREDARRVTQARKRLAALQASPRGAQIPERQRAALVASTQPNPPMRRRGRPTLYDDAHYREVAEVYALAYNARSNPTQLVADRWTIAESTAARWVREARKRGHLPHTAPGIAAARNTEGSTL